MKYSRQTSESIRLGVLLAAAGGFMDAYSYMCRDHVFANAQTGNILLFGIRISGGDYKGALRYLIPVLAFSLGIALAETVRIRSGGRIRLHWRQTAVLVEALVLAGVCFIPQRFSLAANSLTSLACGIQVESFRKIHGNGIATTMCIGNLRSATQNLCQYGHTKNREHLEKGILYYGVIICFVLGAIIGNVCVNRMAERAILVCAVLLFLAFVMMFKDGEKKKGKTG